MSVFDSVQSENLKNDQRVMEKFWNQIKIQYSECYWDYEVKKGDKVPLGNRSISGNIK